MWFFTGSQHLYGEDTLRQVAAQSQEVVATLQQSPDIPVTVVWRPVLTDAEAIRRAVLEANTDDRVVGIVTWLHTFSPAKMWIAGLTALQKPSANSVTSRRGSQSRARSSSATRATAP